MKLLKMFLILCLSLALVSCMDFGSGYNDSKNDSKNNSNNNSNNNRINYNPGGSPTGGGQGSTTDTTQYEFSTSLKKTDFTNSVAEVPSVNEGTLTSVTISGDKDESVTQTVSQNTLIVLDNLNLNSSDGKGLVIKGTGDVYIKLVGTSSITAGKNAIDADDLTGNLYFYGDGSITITSATKSGIKAKKSKLTIYSGTYSISLPEGSGGDGIRCSNFALYSGKICIKALGKLVKSDYENYPGSKGLQAKAITSSDDGNITIYGGEIEITSYGKAITANYGDYESSSTCGNVEIKNGFLTIRTIGTPVDDTSSTIEDGISPEGIEAKNTLSISGGVVQICSTDDSLNGLKLIDISGGYVFGYATKNDCIDSNSKISISGGTVIALCVTGGPEKAIDTDIGESRNAEFKYTGGTVVAVSKTSSDKPNAGSTSKCIQRPANISSAISVTNGSVELLRYCTPSGTGFGNSAYVLVCGENVSSTCSIGNSKTTVSTTNHFNGLAL